MVKTHSGGDAAPFFWTGSPEELPDFDRNIGNARSIYCFPCTLFVVPHTDSNIRALAIYYTAELLKVNPNGPYFLGGNCTAALLTYEVGKLLTECGHKVDLMILCERDVCQTDMILNLCRSLFGRIERFNRNLPDYKKNPWQSAKFIFLSLCINFLKLMSFPIWKVIKSNNPKYLQEKLANPPLGRAVENEISDLGIYQGSEPLYTMAGYNGKVHLIYIKWGSLGFYRFKFFQKYWRNLATGGSIFYIIEGKYHWPVDWDAISKISKQLMADIETRIQT